MTNTPEQLSDEETGNALVRACYREIHRGHCIAYTRLVFEKPGELSEAKRKEAIEALFMFAAMGWAAFHFMNRGMPLKDKPKAERKQKAKKEPKK